MNFILDTHNRIILNYLKRIAIIDRFRVYNVKTKWIIIHKCNTPIQQQQNSLYKRWLYIVRCVWRQINDNIYTTLHLISPNSTKM